MAFTYSDIEAQDRPSPPSSRIAERIEHLSKILEDIANNTHRICGGPPLSDPAKPGPVPVASGLHSQWAESLSGLTARAERIATTLNNA